MSSPRAPDWTLEEFDTLLNAAGWTDAELARQLPHRTGRAVGALRAGLHRFHQTGNSDMLSSLMREYLAARQGTLTCAVCKDTF